ncbi:unnamed protein product [Brugia timori]|uniref:Uncharacterized protein n=1 Tax=Brugia timori TaxID=42155 RepID=A0A0R3QEB3_9BILA|nr:unnamed protein product [Brugia timori]
MVTILCLFMNSKIFNYIIRFIVLILVDTHFHASLIY